MKKLQNLKQGVKYKGYGIINEYGEFEFIPEQKGSRNGWQKLVKQGDGWTFSSTKNSLVIHINLKREGDSLTRTAEFLKKTSPILNILRDYEF